jgi:hypothetical protein
MSVFHGPQGHGAMREHREDKRKAAIARQAASTPEAKLLTEIYSGGDPELKKKPKVKAKERRKQEERKHDGNGTRIAPG